MKVGLPTYFPVSASVRQDKLDRSAGVFKHGKWLTDEAIDLVQQHFVLNDVFLPEDVLLVDARTATLIGFGTPDQVKPALAYLGITIVFL